MPKVHESEELRRGLDSIFGPINKPRQPDEDPQAGESRKLVRDAGEIDQGAGAGTLESIFAGLSGKPTSIRTLFDRVAGLFARKLDSE